LIFQTDAGTCKPGKRTIWKPREVVLERRNAPEQHASKHHAATGHPIITSFEPDERWFYDYRTGESFAGPKLHAPHSHPVPGPAEAVPSNWQTLLHE
jgi:hypothetical protein